MGVGQTLGNKFEPYITKMDIQDTQIYVGEALPGALDDENEWRIRLIDLSVNPNSILWANGHMDLKNKWTDRANTSIIVYG